MEFKKFLQLMLLLAVRFCETFAGKFEKRLLQHLFESDGMMRHNPIERPVANDSAILYVWFKVSLQQIIDVDEKNQILFSNIWLDLTWTDYHFKWNPSDYGNITKINIDPKRVWKPDILLYNSADEKFDGTFPTNVVIEHTGSVSYIPPGMFKSTCKIDITWFPFDTQECVLKFGSWTYDGGTVDLRFKCSNDSLDTTFKRLNDVNNCSEIGSGDISTYVESGEWNLEGMPGKRTALKYDCCPHPFIDLKYRIKIRRRTLYYGFNLIIPCVLISTMALLTFLLPPDAGEKISLGVTILLSLTVFLMMVAEAMPPTSDSVPVIGMYFACTMIMCSLSVVFTVIVLNYHHRDAESHPIPNWVKKLICTYLANLLCMKNHRRSDEAEFEFVRKRRYGGSNKHRAAAAEEANSAAAELQDRSSKSLLANVIDASNNFVHHSPPAYGNCIADSAAGSCSSRSDLAGVMQELQFITRKISDDVADSQVSSEWKFAARVVDRLCLICFSCFTVVSTCAILFSAPDVFKG